jgi:hypothetical protein
MDPAARAGRSFRKEALPVQVREATLTVNRMGSIGGRATILRASTRPTGLSAFALRTPPSAA